MLQKLLEINLYFRYELSSRSWIILRIPPKPAKKTTKTRKTKMSSQATCLSEYCNAGWSEILTHMSPYGYANFGIAFGLGLSVVGAAWGIFLTGSSLVGAAVKAPRIRSKNLIRYVGSFSLMLRLQWLYMKTKHIN